MRRKAKEPRRRSFGGSHRGQTLQEIGDDEEKKKKRKELEEMSSCLSASSS